MTNKRTRNHLSIVQMLEIHEPSDDMQAILESNEPTDPVAITLRIDRSALNLITALATYDSTNDAEQMRTAMTLYLAVRLGDSAVKQFITEREQQLQEIYKSLGTEHRPEPHE